MQILRDERCESVGVAGLYPCGEGAGFAGGIVSAAVDGIRIARHVVHALNGAADDEQTQREDERPTSKQLNCY